MTRLADTILTHVENAALAVSLVGMSLAIFCGVVAEWLGSSLAWTGEIVSGCLIWVMCIGASAATRSTGGGDTGHISIDLFHASKNIPFINIRRGVSIAVCAAVSAGLLVLGYLYDRDSAMLGNASLVLGIPSWCVYTALPVAELMMLARCVLNIFDIGAPPRDGES